MDNKQPVSREALYEEVWTDPVTKVAQRYGLSDVGLDMLCRNMAIPLPERGHWAKVKAGRKVVRIPLLKVVDEKSVTYLTKVDVGVLEDRARAKRQQWLCANKFARVCRQKYPQTSSSIR